MSGKSKVRAWAIVTRRGRLRNYAVRFGHELIGECGVGDRIVRVEIRLVRRAKGKR